jgi:2-polyprenyl-6-methoxyphenol hydroxylase-like FAD-dependent oxidoreductase
MKIGIIGGGTAGLTTALALQKAGVSFHLFEQAESFREVGAGIMLNKVTKKILHSLGIGNQFDKAVNPITKFTIVNKHLQPVKRIPYNEIGFAIHRPRLIEILSNEINKDVCSLNSRITEISIENKVTVKNNATTYDFDALIAADGIKSVVRQQFLPEVKPEYIGQTMWRGMVNMPLNDFFKNGVAELWGDNKRFGIMHKGGNEYFWYAIRWAKEGEVDVPDVKQYLQNLFSSYHSTVKEIIANGTNIIRTDLKHIPQTGFNWYHQNIAFVGDAIHAVTPDISQGACQAVEGAYLLASLLKNCTTPDEAFKQYQQIRYAKLKLVQQASYQFSRFSHQRKNWQYNGLFMLFNILPNAFLRKKFTETIDINYLQPYFF